MENDIDIPPPSYKIVLLGDSSVGKTCLVHRFITNKFDQNTANTIGAAFITKKYTSANKPDRQLKFEIWDTAGQERYRSLTPMYYRNAKVALVCFDMNNFETTFKTAKFWIEQIELNGATDASDPIEIRLVGNKMDLFDKPQPEDLTEEQQNRAKDQKQETNNTITFHRTSAKDGSGVTEVFDSIIDNLDDDFFKFYFDKKRAELEAGRDGDQLSNILGSRLQNTATSRCC
ncbi:GTP-binding protein of the rab family [Scheffersomyces stipitis CBS 6054]|uniref:GTP-binding protein of the rab family n=1 Tax=Scheffersomyces stipitis (strain ATCC 58785 / CBS 6054 / NBRC 10063 / NRRL Y-11545) TaxID=322104 RepID=A3GFW1_PICST|nr:GTP-binding protein of the rab family [Scheffersomyces stipitis CBS 6054]EAZ63413.1 GTP-binding protein of the rab family [Scheffersomyces stipitis CBS 6054]